MGKKKAPRNAFYYYMLDFKREKEASGETFRGMDDVATRAGCVWTTLTPLEKQPYEKKAQEMKSKTKTAKYTSLEEPIDEVQRRTEEHFRKIKNMEKDIQDLITSNRTNNAFANITFYLAHVNHYCQVGDKYYPAEIAVIRFNLKDGVSSSDVLHSILDIGDLPIGFRLQAEKIAEETHQLPLPPHNRNFTFSTKDMKGMFREVLEYLSYNLGPNDKYPPIFVNQADTDVVTNVFQNLCINNGYEEDMIKIYNLPYLFYILRNTAHLAVADEEVFISKAVALNELEKDVYDYVKGISCPYHTTSDAYPFCSLSKVVRAAYIICDHCCGDLGIDLIPGCHVPSNADPKRLGKRPPSRVKTEWIEPARSGTNTPLPTVSETPQSSASRTTRRPMTTSKLVNYQPPKPKEFEWDSHSNLEPSFNGKDFPSLGNSSGSANIPMNSAWGANKSTTATKVSVGRGRGRLLHSDK